mmetsp:Transcript_11812/g.18137  ORF Transcript_11812/g.18137 Transcript_11812/m.18137 type:complete len:116 (+) Transcript_11812:170-517(+)
MGTPRKKMQEVSWSNFHRKHGTPESYFSCTPLCYDGSIFDDDEDSQGGKGWFTNVLDTLAGFHFNDSCHSPTKALFVDDSSVGSAGNAFKKRNLLRKKGNGSKRKGNVKISQFAR